MIKRRLRLSIFWRIFLSYLVMSTCMITVTTVIVMGVAESEANKQRHELLLKETASRIVERYERGRLRSPRKGFPFLPEILRPHPFAIYQGDRVIYENHAGRLLKQKNLSYRFEANGRQYEILTVSPRIKMLRQLLQKMNRLQFVLIFFASVVVSFLLSWSISRPLKKLGAFSRTYAESNALHDKKDHHIDPKLLKRGDEIGALSRDLDFMVRQTQRQFETQTQLLHDVSHELRAPLARLQAATALIEQQNPDSNHTRRIHHESQRLHQLIERVMDYARSDTTAQFKLRDIVPVIQEQIDNLKFEHPERPVHFHHKDHRQLFCEMDVEMIAGAIENVLRNACQHTAPESAIKITLSKEQQQDAQHLILAIRDHGTGINPDEAEKLLQPFYRAGEQMHTDGFGLGLSIVKRTVEQHRGSIALKNHPEGGLVVKILLPLMT